MLEWLYLTNPVLKLKKMSIDKMVIQLAMHWRYKAFERGKENPMYRYRL